jgi:hypothetical protein
MSRKRKNILILCGSAAGGAAVCVLIWAYTAFYAEIKAADSIKKLEDNLYTIEYKGDYGFSDFLAAGGASSDQQVASYLTGYLSHGFYTVNVKTQKAGCSTVCGQNLAGEHLFGRNFDWKSCKTMIVKTQPADGYKSVSTCNLDFLGFGGAYEPEGFGNRIMACAALYVPLDGMNEKGLCIADLMIETDERINQNTGKTDLTITTAIRLILDHAADVQQALLLLNQYDLHSSADMMHHLSISDAEGNSVVVEYINNKMHVTKTDVVTNFFLTQGDRYGIGSSQSKDRYEKLMEICRLHENTSEGQIKSALMLVNKRNYDVPDEITVWSIVYNQHQKTVDFYFRGKYDNPYEFTL